MPASPPCNEPDTLVSHVAAAIAEPARTRMLCCLMDGHARTATELAAVARVSASTASVHLAKLKAHHLVDVVAQGKHRYFRLGGPPVAAALETLMVLTHGAPTPFAPSTPSRLRSARTCYDHLAGQLAVALHDRLVAQDYLVPEPVTGSRPEGYELSAAGAEALGALGLDLPTLAAQRRRFACACMDWSERRPHLGGALGAALLKLALSSGWVHADLDSRAVTVTAKGARAFHTHFGLSKV